MRVSSQKRVILWFDTLADARRQAQNLPSASIGTPRTGGYSKGVPVSFTTASRVRIYCDTERRTGTGARGMLMVEIGYRLIEDPSGVELP